MDARAVIADLTRAKVLFQRRALLAALEFPQAASCDNAPVAGASPQTAPVEAGTGEERA